MTFNCQPRRAWASQISVLSASSIRCLGYSKTSQCCISTYGYLSWPFHFPICESCLWQMGWIILQICVSLSIDFRKSPTFMPYAVKMCSIAQAEVSWIAWDTATYSTQLTTAAPEVYWSPLVLWHIYRSHIPDTLGCLRWCFRSILRQLSNSTWLPKISVAF